MSETAADAPNGKPPRQATVDTRSAAAKAEDEQAERQALYAQRGAWSLLVVGVVLLATTAGVTVYSQGKNWELTAGPVGDFFGGHLSGFGNIAAFLLMFAALTLQRRELALQRHELELSRGEAAEQTRALDEQHKALVRAYQAAEKQADAMLEAHKVQLASLAALVKASAAQERTADAMALASKAQGETAAAMTLDAATRKQEADRIETRTLRDDLLAFRSFVQATVTTFEAAIAAEDEVPDYHDLYSFIRSLRSIPETLAVAIEGVDRALEYQIGNPGKVDRETLYSAAHRLTEERAKAHGWIASFDARLRSHRENPPPTGRRGARP